MAMEYTSMNTADIKGWDIDDAKRYLTYLHQNNTGLRLYTNRHTVTITPTGDGSGFIVDLNDGRAPIICSNAETRFKILDAVALDHHNRARKEMREWNRAVTGRMSGRENNVDKFENKVSDIIDWVFA